MPRTGRGPNARRTNSYRRDRARATVRSWGMPCAICGQPIDYGLPPGHPRAFEVDEIVPVSRGGSPFDVSNLQPAHRRCNQWRSNHSMEWVRAHVAECPALAKRTAPRPSTDW